MAVKFVSAKCPECGANLQLPDTLDKAHCIYCGATVIIDKSAESTVNIDNLLKLAERELKSKNLDKTLNYCEQAFLLNPDHPSLLEMYQRVLLRKGLDFYRKGVNMKQQGYPAANIFFNNAFDCYEKILSFNPNNVEAIYGKVEVILQNGNLADNNTL